MIHPLFRTLATRPELLAEHLGAYAELATVEVSETTARLRHRALWAVGLVACTALAVGLGGAALLIYAAIAVDTMPLPWLLIATPATPAVGALVCWWQMHSRPAVIGSMELLRQQFALDTAMLREASDA